MAGYSTTSNGSTHAFLSGPNGGPLIDLGTLGGSNSYGSGVNDSGQVAGYSETSSGSTHALLSDLNGGPLKDLGTLGGNNSRGYGVNTSGQVAGYSETSSGDSHAFLSGPNGVGLTDLGTFPGTTSSYGNSVNDSGQVVGLANTPKGGNLAFLYENGTMIDLNTLIDPTSGFILNVATNISDTGFIIGSGTNKSGIQEAFLLTPTDINPVPEASTTVSLGLLLALGGVMIAAKRKKQSA